MCPPNLAPLKIVPVGPFVHEEEELEAPTPSKFPVIATPPGSLLVVRERQVGGMAVVEDTLNHPVAQVLRWDGAGTHPRVIDTCVLVQSGLLVANPQRPKEYWCPCQQYVRAVWWGDRFRQNGRLGGGGGCWKVAGRGAGRGSGAGRICCKGARKRCWKGTGRWKGPLEGSA